MKLTSRIANAKVTFPLISSALVVWLALPAQADLQSAAEAHKRGDYAASFREFRGLAEHGNVNAQYQLGVIYETGQGDFPSESEAIRWYVLAAEQGHPCAQYNLAVRYDKGRGVPQQYREAVRWYRLAAEQAHPEAQLNLGVKYAQGHGVRRDYTQAALWFRLAAKRGSVKALFNLGVLYENGWGVLQDPLRAYMFYDLSASQSYHRAQARRDALSIKLSSPEVAETQRLAQAWRQESLNIPASVCCSCLLTDHKRHES